MNALLLPLLFLAAALPSLAGFAQPLQTIRLDYGQKSATAVFTTADGSHITKARPDCDCVNVRTDGNRLVATIDTSTFDAPVDKHIDTTTSDGQRSTLTLRFNVPQAIIITPPRSLVWARGSEPRAQEFRLSIPQGSPIRALLSADLSGEDFDYRASTLRPGREYAITVTPKSTARKRVNRLVIKMDGPAPLYAQRILYLQVK